MVMAAARNVPSTAQATVPIDDSGKTVNLTVNMGAGVQTGVGLKKYTGSSLSKEDSPDKVVYLSTKKQLTYYVNEAETLVFRDRAFVTDNPAHRQVIESDSKFGSEVFANEYPPHILKQFEEDKRFLTRDKEEYE